jgi:FKBP-type peptidyl-prolyl cis-trans isomerase FklB
MLQQGINQINTQMTKIAFDDVFGKKSLAIQPEQCNELIQRKMTELQKIQQEEKDRKGQIQKANGEKFLSENAKKPGIMTTASGLQYEILLPGTGTLHPNASDTVVVDYAGTLIDGKEFDNSFKRGQPAEFPLNQVIRGWTEVLQLMTQGAKWKVYIPYNLAYGEQGREPTIPGYAPLIFEISLREIKPAAQQ